MSVYDTVTVATRFTSPILYLLLSYITVSSVIPATISSVVKITGRDFLYHVTVTHWDGGVRTAAI